MLDNVYKAEGQWFVINDKLHTIQPAGVELRVSLYFECTFAHGFLMGDIAERAVEN